MEDYEEEGTVPIATIKESFETLELNIEPELLEYILFVIYQKSESIDKMRYTALLDLVDGKLL